MNETREAFDLHNPACRINARCLLKRGGWKKLWVWKLIFSDTWNNVCPARMNQPQTPDNEVARLRELLERAIEAIPDSLMDEDGGLYENPEHMKLKAELDRLAPAPLPKPTLSRDSYDEDWNLKKLKHP